MTYATDFLFLSFIAELILSAYFFLTANEIPKINNKTEKGNSRRKLTPYRRGRHKNIGAWERIKGCITQNKGTTQGR